MLVGILGEAGSGKDTAGQILVQEHGFYSLALADPIKLFCMWMFRWTPQQLWGDSQLRNKEDGHVPFIRCPDCGTFYPRALTQHGRTGLVCAVCTCSTDDGNDWLHGLSARFALQHLGTEWARTLHPSCHIDFALKRAADIQRHGVSYDPLWHVLPKQVLQERVVPEKQAGTTPVYVSDCRFRNEVQRIQEARGKVYRIQRHSKKDNTTTGIAGHASEMEQREITDGELDGVIENEGTVDALRECLRTLIQP